MAEMRNRNRGDALIDLRAAGPAQRAPADGLRKCVIFPFGAPVTRIVVSGLPAAVADIPIAGALTRVISVFLGNAAYLINGMTLGQADGGTAAQNHRMNP